MGERPRAVEGLVMIAESFWRDRRRLQRAPGEAQGWCRAYCAWVDLRALPALQISAYANLANQRGAHR